MSYSSTADARQSRTYGLVAITLHWLIAAAILYELWLGYSIDPDLDFKAIQTHKSLGITILALSVLRLLWRLIHRPPPLPANMPRWEKIGAHLSPLGFYALMLGVPLLGWAYVSASPFSQKLTTKIWGLAPLPLLPFIQNNDALAHQFFALHEFFAYYGFLGLLALHVGAALKHQFWDRDAVMHRMIPFVSPPRRRP